MFVLDTSIAACWCLADEVHPVAEAALLRLEEQSAIVPALFWFELRNVLVMAERRKRISEAHTARSLSLLGELKIKTDREPGEGLTMSLARTHKLSVYDAAYLELALRHMVPLATLDGAMITAAKVEAVALVGV